MTGGYVRLPEPLRSIPSSAVGLPYLTRIPHGGLIMKPRIRTFYESMNVAGLGVDWGFFRSVGGGESLKKETSDPALFRLTSLPGLASYAFA